MVTSALVLLSYFFIQIVLFLKAVVQRLTERSPSLCLTACVVRVSGTAMTSLVPGRVKFTETDTIRPLTPSGTALMDSVSTH